MVWGRPHSILSLQSLPALQNFPFCLILAKMWKPYWKRHCLSNQQFSELLSQDVVARLPGKMAKPPWSWRMLLPESILSSWKSSWAALGQVNMPAAFLEHSGLQTLISLTHISNREGCSPETRKTAPSNPGSIPVVLQYSLFTKKPLWRCLISEATNGDFSPPKIYSSVWVLHLEFWKSLVRFRKL